jgi:hypothetical protein
MIRIHFSMIKRTHSRRTYYTTKAIKHQLAMVGASAYTPKPGELGSMILHVYEWCVNEEEALHRRKEIERALRQAPERGQIEYQFEAEEINQ